jgi:hypothetical protein
MRKEKLNTLVSQINTTQTIYLNDILFLVSDALEVISGFPKNRIYLPASSHFNCTDDMLEPVHIRGYPQYPIKNISLSLNADKDNSSCIVSPLSKTHEATAHNDRIPVIVPNYAGTDREGSNLLGSILRIQSSLIFPVVLNNTSVGICTIDSTEHVPEKVLTGLVKPVNEFFRKIISTLAEAIEYRNEIHQGKKLNELINSKKLSSVLNMFIQEGIADLAALFLLKEDGLKEDRLCLVPFSSSSADGNDLTLLQEAIAKFGGVIDIHSRDFFITSEMILKRNYGGRKYNSPELVSFKDIGCLFEREMRKQGGYNSGIYYLAVDSYGKILFSIVLFLGKNTYRRVRKRCENNNKYLKDIFKGIVKRINSLLYDLPDCSLVTEQLLEIYLINSRYEEFNRMKDIRNGLTGFLKMILHKIMIITGADNGIIGIVETIGEKGYVSVEKEGGILIGAKIGDINDTYIKPLCIGTKEELLTKELSLTGMAAAYKKTMVFTGLEQPDKKIYLREPFPDMGSAMATPVLVEGKTIAVIHISSRRKYAFARKTQTLLEMITDIVKDNMHKLIKKYKVSIEVLRLYGGSYPYIKNDALNYLAGLFDNYLLDLNRFMNDILKNYKVRRRNKKDRENYITLKDIKKAFFDSKLETINLSDYMEETDNVIAHHIYMKLKNRKATFFDAVQAEYAKHNISRRVAILVFEKAKLAVKKSQITKIAVHLNACSENYQGDYEEKKKIERFREFYKKTIGIKL